MFLWLPSGFFARLRRAEKPNFCDYPLTVNNTVTITGLTYKPNHLEVALDSGEILKLPSGIAEQYGLSKGQVLDDMACRQLREESERFFCRQKALDYLSIKNRTSQEMEKHLARKGFSPHIIREIAAALADAGYLNDLKYARSYIEARRTAKLVGKNLLKKELLARGVSRDIARKALDSSEYPEENFEEVYRVAEKKYRSLEGRANPLQKTAFFLRQRGFDHEICARVLDRLKKEGPDNIEGA